MIEYEVSAGEIVRESPHLLENRLETDGHNLPRL
jgi:hypothetical protein